MTTSATEILLDEIAEALFRKKAVMLRGPGAVGKTYLSRLLRDKLKDSHYNLFANSASGEVILDILPCHSGISYIDVVGGITADTCNNQIVFEYKDRILVKTVKKATSAYKSGSNDKSILLLDNFQTINSSSVFGELIEAIGCGQKCGEVKLNSGERLIIPPNFYLIATVNTDYQTG